MSGGVGGGGILGNIFINNNLDQGFKCSEDSPWWGLSFELSSIGSRLLLVGIPYGKPRYLDKASKVFLGIRQSIIVYMERSVAQMIVYPTGFISRYWTPGLGHYSWIFDGQCTLSWIGRQSQLIEFLVNFPTYDCWRACQKLTFIEV